MVALPIAKLGGVLIRQMSKPLANFAKERAKSNHFFRIYICMPPAQSMVAAGFPIAKLTGLLIKQMSKPLANFAKERAKNNHFFRTYICMPPAQFYHWWEVRMKMYVMNIGRSGSKSDIPKLNEQAAIELGASLLGEGLLFSVAVIVLVVEYNRQKSNEKIKEQKEKDYLMSVENRLSDLSFANEELDTKVRELTRLLYASGNNQKVKSQTETKNISQGKLQEAIEVVQSNMKSR